MFSEFKFRAPLLCKGIQKDLKGVEAKYLELVDKRFDCSELEITVIGSEKLTTIPETEELMEIPMWNAPTQKPFRFKRKPGAVIEFNENRRSADSSIRNTIVSPMHFDGAAEKEEQSLSLDRQSCSAYCKNFDEYLAEHEKTADLMLSAFAKKRSKSK